MCNCAKFLARSAYYISLLSYPIASILSVIACVLCWIGFAVPDWLFYYSSSNLESIKFGLWNICTLPSAHNSGMRCTYWFYNAAKPDFLVTTQVLITLGCAFSTITIVLAVLRIASKDSIFKYFPIFSGITSFVSVIFFVIGICVFGGDSYNYIINIGGVSYYRRWGYWLYVPAIVCLSFSSVLFPFDLIYDYLVADSNYSSLKNKGNAVNFDRNLLPFAMEPYYQNRKDNMLSLMGLKNDQLDIFPKFSRNMLKSKVSSRTVLPSIQGWNANDLSNSIILNPWNISSSNNFSMKLSEINPELSEHPEWFPKKENGNNYNLDSSIVANETQIESNQNQVGLFNRNDSLSSSSTNIPEEYKWKWQRINASNFLKINQ